MPDKKPKVVIRADGNREIGFGHVFRCLALAQMLNKYFECWFYIQNPEPFLKAEIEKVVYGIIELPNESDFGIEASQITQHALNGNEIVVLDGYHFDLDYQKAIKANGNPLVFIDDLAEQHFVADVVINHAGGVQKEEYLIESYTKLCIGSEYALLRPEFLTIAKEDRNFDQINSLFLSLGGSVQPKLLYGILESFMKLEVKNINVLGSGTSFSQMESFKNKNLPTFNFYNNLSASEVCTLISKCQIAITPASTISLECCAVGIGLLTGYTVDNQLNIYEGLINKGMAIGVGRLSLDENLNLLSQTEELINFPNKISSLKSKQRNTIDGYSDCRIQKVFSELAVL